MPVYYIVVHSVFSKIHICSYKGANYNISAVFLEALEGLFINIESRKLAVLMYA